MTSLALYSPPRAPKGPESVIIVGGGLAGLFCALKLAPKAVTVLAAAPIGRGASSAWAQAGIAAAVGPGDTIESHVTDTIIAGDGIVDEAIIRTMAKEASGRIHDLLDYGVPFDRDLEGHLSVSREAAHSQNRIVRVRGDMAGRAIMEALVAAVRKTPSIRVLEGYVVEDLIAENGQVTGVVARDKAGSGAEPHRITGSNVVMATGGIGHLYEVTTNPTEARGGGIGMAARAGARMADMEFVQFHPTAINVGKDPAPLATEALRGHGATLHNKAGERFMLPLHPDAELAPRDVVARGIFAEIRAGRGAGLDCRTAVHDFASEFPTVFGYCQAAGIDPAREMIPVIPAAHYFMGGIWTDVNGRTSLPGFWACGECTSTGAHGANRLASNSLLEAVVFSARIAEALKAEIGPDAPATWQDGSVTTTEYLTENDHPNMVALRQVMSAHLGVLRDGAGMREALDTILQLARDSHSVRFDNVITTAKLIAVCALNRIESRGGHFRTDYPEEQAEWKRRTLLTLEQADAIIPDLLED
ncbi:L-aspartate oxidase [Hoeflea sp. YIM 152468]|uniref:L-aspartate oxidase n=1 Tax=Hoeflea sp. YIM 152468 TaxID=3031759 RepID=UPI0023DC7D89|nr:L-aspartate oxidase [Hoeflea sp. YIM 152468]MDF1607742.1 L-aspartate oxidase [Hoeflea sp. YIM 152468]